MLDPTTATTAVTAVLDSCKEVISVPQHPSVGEASIILATISILPPLLWKAVTDSKVSRGIWVAIIIGCMTLELYAIKWDQMKRASEQEHSECIARKQFAEVVAGLSQTKRGLDATASGIDTASNRLQGISGQITNVLQKTQEAADMASEGVANLTGVTAMWRSRLSSCHSMEPVAFRLLPGLARTVRIVRWKMYSFRFGNCRYRTKER
jgi:hypothetical protein